MRPPAWPMRGPCAVGALAASVVAASGAGAPGRGGFVLVPETLTPSTAARAVALQQVENPLDEAVGAASALAEPYLSGFRDAEHEAVRLLQEWSNSTWPVSWVNETHGHNAAYPTDYKLLRREDMASWVIFFTVFIFLILLDNFVLHSSEENLSFGRASLYSLFWLLCAGAFCIYVYFVRGAQDAFDWGTGYLLEWMLSVDNLFVFRSIFVVFQTPDDQKHKPLFWGIVGAIIFRMVFFIIGEMLLHSFTWMHFVLGAFLVYTGLKIMFTEEEEASPEDDPLLQKVTKVVPYVNAYAPKPLFFARIHDPNSNSMSRQNSQAMSRPNTPRTSQAPSAPNSARAPADAPVAQRMGSKGLNTGRSTTSLASDSSDLEGQRPPLRATRLLLVVICLEITDLVFAVDSVSAIVAQIPDLFLAYTACVFAMLGLRATFFVVDELVKLFSLLSYAVACILIFIGSKLCLKQWIHVPPEVVCFTLVTTLLVSLVGSIIYEKLKARDPDSEAEEKKHGPVGEPTRVVQHKEVPPLALTPDVAKATEPEYAESEAARS